MSTVVSYRINLEIILKLENNRFISKYTNKRSRYESDSYMRVRLVSASQTRTCESGLYHFLYISSGKKIGFLKPPLNIYFIPF